MGLLDDTADELLIIYTSTTVQGKLAEVLTAVSQGTPEEVIAKLNRIIVLIAGQN